MLYASISHVDPLRNVRLGKEQRVGEGERLVQVINQVDVPVLHDMHVFSCSTQARVVRLRSVEAMQPVVVAMPARGAASELRMCIWRT